MSRDASFFSVPKTHRHLSSPKSNLPYMYVFISLFCCNQDQISFLISIFFTSKRHRLVNETLKDELASGVHALSIQVISLKQCFD